MGDLRGDHLNIRAQYERGVVALALELPAEVYQDFKALSDKLLATVDELRKQAQELFRG